MEKLDIKKLWIIRHTGICYIWNNYGRGKAAGGASLYPEHEVCDYASAHIPHHIYKLSVCNLMYSVVSFSELPCSASMMKRKSPV